MASASGRSRLAGAFLALAASSWLAACAQDDVLPSHEVVATCGNGVTDANEECDVASPGCVNCQVQPEWTCTASGCTPLCVDGVVGSGPACNNPHRDTACDLSGFWAVREKSYLRDTVFGALQVSSQWYLYEISQTGDAFVIDASLDCAVHVTGSATIDFPPATKRGQIWLNPQDGTNTMWPRRSGTSMPVANGCAVSLEPWYFVWGATTAYVPTNFEGGVPIESLPPLPSVPNPINDNLFPLGATDPTTVGIPGFGTVISGILPGLRYSAQRSVTSFATTPGASVANAAMTLVMPGRSTCRRTCSA